LVHSKQMRKLIQVEEAKELMNEAKDWGVWRWLLEKKRVRAAADRAVDALNELDQQVKATWSEGLVQAYRELEDSKGKRRHKEVAPELKAAARRVKEADDEAEAARLDAENTFDEAERQLSAAMARQGAQKAIDSWELREKSIRKAEAAGRQCRRQAGQDTKLRL
jgi:hypothetical protein